MLSNTSNTKIYIANTYQKCHINCERFIIHAQCINMYKSELESMNICRQYTYVI